MSEPVKADLFVEDRAHEEFLRPLLIRVASEIPVGIVVRIRSARGGHAKAIEEFVRYQSLLEKGAVTSKRPELVVVGIDGNCTTSTKKRAEIEKARNASLAARLVAACPDPHVERWYLADPDSFANVVGYRPSVGTKKCERDHYKRLLADAVRKGGYPPTLGGVEFASDLVAAMDFYRAGKGDGSLKAFLDDLRDGLQGIRAGRGAAG